MTHLNQKLIIALVIIPILIGIFRSPKEMLIAVAAIGLALFFTNIEKFSRFKGAGFEAELRTAVDKAYAAIDELKELGLSLSAPIVDELAISGRLMQYIPLIHKLERVEKIAETLRKLGASQAEIDQACSTIYDRVENDNKRRILHSLKKANPGSDALFEGINDEKMDNWTKIDILKFIENEELKKDAETNECILDFEFFLKNKKLRRPDKWQS